MLKQQGGDLSYFPCFWDPNDTAMDGTNQSVWHSTHDTTTLRRACNINAQLMSTPSVSVLFKHALLTITISDKFEAYPSLSSKLHMTPGT